MLPLSGLDASFLHAESATAHMHTLKVLVLERPTGTRDLRAALLRRLKDAVAALPALRLRPRSGPLGLWVWEEATVELPAHVTMRTILGAEGVVERVIGDFASRPLRRDRPLWELLALDDPRRRELVLVLKIHHAAADGRAAERMLEIAAGAAPPSAVEGAARATFGALLLLALARLARVALSWPSTVARAIGGALRSRRLGAASARPFGGPPASFARPVTASRRVAFASVRFDDVVAIKQRAGVTVNDVVLAMTAAAVREHLRARGERTDRPLVASMPVGVGEARYSLGNRLSNVLVPIHVEERDAWARLARASASASAAKALHAARGADLLMRWSELVPALALRTLWRLIRLSRRAPVDLVVSNVPGPRAPLSIGGAALERIYSVGPLLETTGLNVTCWSYAGRLHACVLACGDHDCDPEAIARGLERGLEELLGEARVAARAAA